MITYIYNIHIIHMITYNIYIYVYIYICKKKKYMHCGKPNGQPPFEYFGMVYTTLFWQNWAWCAMFFATVL